MNSIQRKGRERGEGEEEERTVHLILHFLMINDAVYIKPRSMQSSMFYYLLKSKPNWV